MNGQLALFDDPPRARRHDPATSKKAAQKAMSFKAHHEGAIYAAICEAENGRTAKEIAIVTGLTDVQVNRRLSNMGERGLIERRAVPGGKPGEWQERGRCAVWWKK